MKLQSLPVRRGVAAGATAAVLLGVASGAAAPANASAGPSCDADSCTMTYSYTGATQTFTVPAGVDDLKVSVSGAQGGGLDFGNYPGPGGAVVTGDLPVTSGQDLTVLVGLAGVAAGGPTFGGGGATAPNSHLASGGGGSFIFDAAGAPLLVAGGGGGRSNLVSPPAGSGAGAGPGGTGGSGVSPYGSGDTAATGGSQTAPGVHGTSQYGWGSGTDGSGPASAGAPGVGGAGGDTLGDMYTGSGGGGGYYGGGGGGYSASGGGGSGYADPSVTVLTSSDGANLGNGVISITWALLPQAITFTSALPTSAQAGSTLAVTTTGGASGNPVVLSVDASTSSSACSISGATLSFDHAGTCVVDATQAGNLQYAPAPTAQESVLVTTVPSVVSLSSVPTVFGQPVEVTATVTSGGDAPEGSVQFAVDGDDVGSPVTLVGGSAHSPALTTAGGLPLAPGGHAVTATYVPADASVNDGAVGTMTQVVDHATTATTVTVHATTIGATVTPVAPGAGVATGTVTFSVGGRSVGTADLVDGAVVLPYVVPTGMTQTVAAVFSGDDSFAASSASTSRSDPSISTTVTSARPKSRSGWYRTPVTVTFHCTTNGAPLTTPCPDAVQLTANGAAQSTSRTIAATDGGVATVTVAGINVDRTAPLVQVRGVKSGAVYGGKAPAAHCVARDSFSGVSSCTITRHSRGSLTTFTATATDKAGNTTTRHGTYRVLSTFVQGASYRAGAFTLRAGHTYTLVVAGQASRPTYYDASLYPRKPSRRDMAFNAAGHHRWALGVTIDRSMRQHAYWNLGVKVGHTMRTIKVRVTR